MDTVSSIDKLECLYNNCRWHKSSVLLISTLCSLILLGSLFFHLESAIQLTCCHSHCTFFHQRMALTVHTWVKPIFTKRECQEGEAKSFCSQVWWKIAIVCAAPSPSTGIGHLDPQKCHSSDTSDILETLQFANGRRLEEVKDLHAHTQMNPSCEKTEINLLPSFNL